MKSFGSIPLQLIEARPRVTGPRLGRIVSFVSGERPVVDFPGNPLGPRGARVASRLTQAALAEAQMVCDPVLLLFEDNDPTRPLIVDVIRSGPEAEAPAIRTKRRASRVPPGPAIAEQPATPPSRLCLASIVEARVEGILVDLPGAGQREVRSTVPLRNLKDPVLVVVLEDGTCVIVGQLLSRTFIEPEGGTGAEVVLKGSKITIDADAELVIRSGGCTIRLDALGQLELTGEKIVSRARGANKVQGGSVQLN